MKKIILWWVLILIVVVLSGFALFVLYDRYQIMKRQSEVKKVSFEIKYDPIKCTAKSPLRVIIGNYSNRSILETTWTMTAHLRFHSRDVISDGEGLIYTTDQIMRSAEGAKTGMGAILCYKAPKLKRGLTPDGVIWGVREVDVSFVGENEELNSSPL